MKKILLILVILTFCVSAQSQDRLNVKSKQLFSTYSDNSPALLLDQNTLPTAQSIVSNQLRGRHPDSNLVQCSDNFTVPGGVSWTIDSIALTGTYSVATNMDSMVVAIYPDVAGTPGTNAILIRTTRPVLGITTGTNMALKLTSPIVLPTGNYWISLYAVYNTAATLAQGRWNWSTSTTATGLPCHIRDYTGLFGLPPFPWTPTNTLVPGELSHLFALFGTSGAPPVASSLCFSRNGVGLAIPDLGPGPFVYDTLKVPSNAGTITDITVKIDTLTHTYLGDLIARLSHGGQTDTLFSRMGTGTFGNSTVDMINVKFTDSATVPINSLNNTTNPSGGTYLPGGRTGVDSLRKHFVGQNLAGNWVIGLNDNATPDVGILQAWSICFYSNNITQIISSNTGTPDRYSLGQNYPNPFNPTTKIRFALPKAGLVSLKVYDMLGKEVQTLVSQQLNAGEFIADFDGANLSSGTYFYRLQVGDFVEIKKMVLLK